MNAGDRQVGLEGPVDIPTLLWTTNNMTKNQVFLRINAKSLACEARSNRHEADKIKRHYRRIGENVSFDDTWLELESHRKWDLRCEARATHLLRAFLDGRPYWEVEPKADWSHYKWRMTVKRLHAKCQRYHVKFESVKEWFEKPKLMFDETEVAAAG